jgi:hypothetical protein
MSYDSSHKSENFSVILMDVNLIKQWQIQVLCPTHITSMSATCPAHLIRVLLISVVASPEEHSCCLPCMTVDMYTLPRPPIVAQCWRLVLSTGPNWVQSFSPFVSYTWWLKQIQLPKRRIVLNTNKTMDNLRHNFIINNRGLVQLKYLIFSLNALCSQWRV